VNSTGTVALAVAWMLDACVGTSQNGCWPVIGSGYPVELAGGFRLASVTVSVALSRGST
jgi:hypothetical protein